MARRSAFANSDSDTVAGTASQLNDVVSISNTGGGSVQYLVIKAITNADKIDYYSIEIDGETNDFVINLPFSGTLGVLTTPNALMEMKGPFFFNSTFKIQAFFNDTVSVDFKYSVGYHKGT